MNPDQIANLESQAAQLRYKVVELSNKARTPHLGSQLSCIDLLVGCFWHAMRIDESNPHGPERDQFILSKGHAAPALYASLAYRGLLDFETLDDFGHPGSVLAEQPSPNCVAGVEWATGSLGHGLGVAMGKAMAARIAKRDSRFLVLMSDGECNEGSVWEAAMFAAAQKLENLLVIIDFNKWQATARSQETLALDPFVDKWTAFGWSATEIDGHDMKAVIEALNRFPADNGKPTAVVAHTIKGKGVSFMEDDNNWHYRIPTEEEVARACKMLLTN